MLSLGNMACLGGFLLSVENHEIDVVDDEAAVDLDKREPLLPRARVEERSVTRRRVPRTSVRVNMVQGSFVSPK